MPTPAPEMAALKAFDGSWTCEGYVPAGPMGPGGKTKGTVKSGADLGGFWQSGIVKSRLADMPEFEGEFHMTYDPANKNYVMLWVDNMGGWARGHHPAGRATPLSSWAIRSWAGRRSVRATFS